MRKFPIIIRTPRGQPNEGVVQAESVDAAIAVARSMGHDVDEAATLKLEKDDEGRPGRAAAIVAAILMLAAWLFIEAGIGAIILSTIAIERSRGRRGLAVLVLSFGITVFGQLLWYYILPRMQG